MNKTIAHVVLQAAIDCGVREFIFCAGVRNVSLLEILRKEERVTVTYWPEERSAAFFALGRSRLTKRPVAIVVTSGTAVGELLPAVMEAHYLQVPLLCITADRPASFRGSGAPQAAEQVALFGSYTKLFLDIQTNDMIDLSVWDQLGAAHVNVCLEEPKKQQIAAVTPLNIPVINFPQDPHEIIETNLLDIFFEKVNYPIVLVSELEDSVQSIVIDFLESLGAPILMEGTSGIREHPRLQHLALKCTDQVLERAKLMDYPIDGVLRIGGVPTPRIWRDLEYLEGQVLIYSISDQPFSGISWNKEIVPTKIIPTLKDYIVKKKFNSEIVKRWLEIEQEFENSLLELFQEYPSAEPSLIYNLSKLIPDSSHIYLGNSLPIREWSLAATRKYKNFSVTASRGLCGIDGQISTFLGLCQQKRENWAILGDLTTIYDLAGFWVVPQLDIEHFTVVVINNGGGEIFKRMFPYHEMLNQHDISFEGLAMMWKLDYLRLTSIPETHVSKKHQLIEVIPDPKQTEKFWVAEKLIRDRYLY